VNVCDWRDAGVDLLAPLYAHGQERWQRALDWDTSDNWRQIEQARTTWGLPGLLALDEAGRVRGWTFFLPQDNLLHVGGLVAETPLATRALLDRLLEVCDACGADGVSCFVFEEAAGLADEIARRGFDTEPFLYLSRDTASGATPVGTSGADSWCADDIDEAAALLRAAYRPEVARHFAPGHTAEAWARYVRHLVEQTGLGTFNAEATRVVRGADCIDAIVIVTALSADTAHLAQVVVHPSRRGSGLAASLVAEACSLAGRQGYGCATLLVGASNAAAVRLYDSLGFVPRARFLAAHRLKTVS